MKNLCLTTSLFLAALACFAASPAMAQTEYRVQFSSPFAFKAGLASLPAGEYVITKQTDVTGVYLISNRDNAASAMVIARASDTVAPTTKPNVNFTKHEGQYFLDSVALADGSVVLLSYPPQSEVKPALMVRKVRMVK